MITRHHMALALMCALIISSSFFFSNPLMMVLVTAGTCIGVLLPDIHMTRPKHVKLRSLAWLIVQFPRRICAPVLCRIYAYMHHPVQDPGDKRLIHSLPGALFVFGCTAAILLVPAYAVGDPFVSGTVTVFLFGVFLGIALHLIEDLCTRKGIFPFFPFSAWTVSGSIRPCDRTDPRIGQYHIQHCMVLLVFFGLDSTGLLAPSLFMLLSIAGLSICLGTMVWLSEISIRKGSRKPEEKKLPLPAEQ